MQTALCPPVAFSTKERPHTPGSGTKRRPSHGTGRQGGGCRCARDDPVYRRALEHPVHPARMKNDRVRQVSWLAGRCRSGRLLRTGESQWRNGRMARRLQLQGQPGFLTRFPFDPLRGNLSRRRNYRGDRMCASAIYLRSAASLRSRCNVTGARKGLIGKSGRRRMSPRPALLPQL